MREAVCHGRFLMSFNSDIDSVLVLGRTLPNILADKIGPLNVIAPCTLLERWYNPLHIPC